MAKTKYPKLPTRLYIEAWPEHMGRELRIHFEQTGYGVDMASGETSRITVYTVAPKKKRKADR